MAVHGREEGGEEWGIVDHDRAHEDEGVLEDESVFGLEVWELCEEVGGEGEEEVEEGGEFEFGEDAVGKASWAKAFHEELEVRGFFQFVKFFGF